MERSLINFHWFLLKLLRVLLVRIYRFITKSHREVSMSNEKTLSTFEKYLAVWVAVCMILGLVLSQTIP